MFTNVWRLCLRNLWIKLWFCFYNYLQLQLKVICIIDDLAVIFLIICLVDKISEKKKRKLKKHPSLFNIIEDDIFECFILSSRWKPGRQEKVSFYLNDEQY